MPRVKKKKNSKNICLKENGIWWPTLIQVLTSDLRYSSMTWANMTSYPFSIFTVYKTRAQKQLAEGTIFQLPFTLRCGHMTNCYQWTVGRRPQSLRKQTKFLCVLFTLLLAEYRFPTAFNYNQNYKMANTVNLHITILRRTSHILQHLALTHM